jgi:membrane protein DedA with SNARE-associated domain
LKGKSPQLLVIAIVVVFVVIVLLSTLEDTLIEGGSFTGTPLAALLNAIVTLTQNVTTTISSWGYGGIFVLMLLESSSLPIPSEVILPFSGYLISLGELNVWLTILVATVAGLAGSSVDYYIGMKGMDLLARRKTLSSVLFSKERMETVKRWFDKYGPTAVLLSRLIPGFRTLVSFPAGAVRMPIAKFLVYTTAGCLAWNAFLIYVGEYIGANWREVAGISHYLIIGFLVAIFVVFVGYLIKRRMDLHARDDPTRKGMKRLHVCMLGRQAEIDTKMRFSNTLERESKRLLSLCFNTLCPKG